MADRFGLVVRFTLREGAAVAFDQLMVETVEAIRAHEPGTLIYAVHRVEGQPDSRLLYELYRDRAAFDEHESQAHTRRFLEERNQYVAGFEVTFLSHLVVGVPLPPGQAT